MSTPRLFALLILSGCAACAHEESGPRPVIATRNAVEEFASILNRNIPEFREMYDPRGFAVVDGRPLNFFVYNLADTTNVFPRRPIASTVRIYSDTNPFVLNERGVYHFAPLRFDVSFSHIAILDNGHLWVFPFVNCEGRGESVRDVVKFLVQTASYSDTVIARVENYRSYGVYFQMDPQSQVMCKPSQH